MNVAAPLVFKATLLKQYDLAQPLAWCAGSTTCFRQYVDLSRFRFAIAAMPAVLVPGTSSCRG